MKLFLDDIRPAPPGWYRARTAAVAIMHLSGGDVEELSLDHDLDVCVLCEEEAASAEAELRADGVDVDAFLGRLHEAIAAKLKGKPMPKIALFCSSHDRGNGLDVVDWMIRTGVWPRTRPVVHSANESRAAIMRDRIEAYWRPRVDLERAPKFVCAAHYGDDAAEVMGCYTPQEAVASFARGRWRLVGCPASMWITATDERGNEQGFGVRCSAEAFVVVSEIVS